MWFVCSLHSTPQHSIVLLYPMKERFSVLSDVGIFHDVQPSILFLFAFVH